MQGPGVVHPLELGRVTRGDGGDVLKEGCPLGPQMENSPETGEEQTKSRVCVSTLPLALLSTLRLVCISICISTSICTSISTYIPRHKRIHAYKCHVLVAGSIDILADCSKHFVFSSRISNDDHDDPQAGMVQNYAQL